MPKAFKHDERGPFFIFSLEVVYGYGGARYARSWRFKDGRWLKGGFFALDYDWHDHDVVLMLE